MLVIFNILWFYLKRIYGIIVEENFFGRSLNMDNFEKLDVSLLDGNFFKKIGKEWMLITAGDENGFNTMTASWGGIGVLWNRNVAFTFIRKSRYTYEFADKADCYTLSFFGGGFMKELAYCGKHSGRTVDKIKETGLTPIIDGGSVYFGQAELVLVCKKLYKQPITADGFVDKAFVDNFYADDDWHEMFVGEIVDVLVKKP